MPKNDSPRIAVLGAGPIGLEAALYARHLNLPVTIYERGKVGDHVARWGHVRMFSPFGMNVTPLGRAAIRSEFPKHEFPGDNDLLTAKEYLHAYLEPIAKSDPIREFLRTETRVMSVGRRGLLKEEYSGDARRAGQPFRILVRDAKNVEHFAEADIVLDCTGTYGRHRWLGDGGIPAAGETAAENQIIYHLEDVLGGRKSFYANKTTLVIGGGYSAATTVCALAQLTEDSHETWVIWLARGAGTTPLKRIAGDPFKERDRLAMRANTLATRGGGGVEYHPQTVIDEIEFLGQDKGFKVKTRGPGKTHHFEPDRVIANVGYSPDHTIYRELQIHECYATLGPMNLTTVLAKYIGSDGLSIPALGANALRTPEPNFFVLGSKSYGRNSNFLLKAGFEQVREVFTLISGKSNLDLYAAARK